MNEMTAPFGIGYVVRALVTAAYIASPLLVAAYLASGFHARGLARLRRHRQQRTRT